MGNRSSKKKPLLFLDLDKTLVFSRRARVRPRPFWKQFLEKMAQVYTVCVFSAGKKEYVRGIVKLMDPERKYISKVFSQKDMVYSCAHGRRLKTTLTMARSTTRRVVILDNLETIWLERANVVKAPPFLGDRNDTFLKRVSPFLLALAKLDRKFTEALRLVQLWRTGSDECMVAGGKILQKSCKRDVVQWIAVRERKFRLY